MGADMGKARWWMAMLPLLWVAPLWAFDEGGWTPPYAALFEQAQQQAAAGETVAAVRALSSIYQEEVPVSAFYVTLEEKAAALSARLLAREWIEIDAQVFEMANIKALHDGLMTDPVVFHHAIGDEDGIALTRFVYALAAAGEAGDPPENPLLALALPELDLAAMTAALDPGLVAVGLWLERHWRQGVNPQAVVARWESRPDLLSPAAERQLRLFFAAQTPRVLAGLVLDEYSPASGIREFREADPHGCWVRTGTHAMIGEADPGYFGPFRVQRWRAIPDSFVRSGAAGGGPSHEPSGEPALETIRPFMVSAGHYKLSAFSDGYRGESALFECRPGTEIRVRVPLYPARH